MRIITYDDLYREVMSVPEIRRAFLALRDRDPEASKKSINQRLREKKGRGK